MKPNLKKFHSTINSYIIFKSIISLNNIYQVSFRHERVKRILNVHMCFIFSGYDGERQGP